MPLYEYECSECGRIKEVFQKISDPPLKECSACKGSVKKLISQSSFRLKGSGWYVTDYGGSKDIPKNKSKENKDETSKPASDKKEADSKS